MDKMTGFNKIPNILMVTIEASIIDTGENIKFKDGETLIHMKLCGIVYFGEFHFTSCIIDSNENLWLHDSMVTGQTSTDEGKLHEYTTKSMKTYTGKNIAIIVYASE
jgi:hypothetical protein